MTEGQRRAMRELDRLCAVGSNNIELLEPPSLAGTVLVASVSLRLGHFQQVEGGLDLREREDCILFIPAGFPFDRPSLSVAHSRFAGFPHVIWGKHICLYQSSLEWNPSDGLYGFFERLNHWLKKAAVNDMDPLEGPLEPPHHNTDFTQLPFVVRANAPCCAGESWTGLAQLENHPNRTELVAWNDLSNGWPTRGVPAIAIILPKALPMEFPTRGAHFFALLHEQGLDRTRIIKNLALAALLTDEGKPLYLVLGLPMRRASDGTSKIHVAVWTAEPEMCQSLRNVLPDDTDSEKITTLRTQLSDAIAGLFEASNMKWCPVLEDRGEIVVRRDAQTPMSYVSGKSILVLGCGALGSWAAEIITRAAPSAISLVDNAIVKPGVLARQNFRLDDIGANKASALASRLATIAHSVSISHFPREAHGFLIEDLDRLAQFDLVFDCTASSIFQMKLERDWSSFRGIVPPIVSFIIDASAQHCLGVVIPKGAPRGVWDSYLCLKRDLCLSGKRPEIVTAIYAERAIAALFQPEPGCSDPTFRGSTADVASLASGALNLAMNCVPKLGAHGFAFSSPSVARIAPAIVSGLPNFHDCTAGNYTIRIATSVFHKAREWADENARLRSARHETGGLLWGIWDDAVQIVWIFDCSGPPPDSSHDPGHFLCGIKGTASEHQRRMKKSYGTCGFVGHWHTHPAMPSRQSGVDIQSMANLVSTFGLNQRRSVMLIFGRRRRKPTAGIYLYESHSLTGTRDVLAVGMSQFELEAPVV